MRIAIQDGEDITGVAIAENRLILPVMVEGDPISQRIRTVLYGEIGLPGQTTTKLSTLEDGEVRLDDNKMPFIR